MRLNFALIYSFLSAAALGALSDNRPRRSLDHLQQATNSTPTHTHYNRVLSGASFVYNGTVNSVTGTFSVPSASSTSREKDGAYFLVGIGDLKNNAGVFGGIHLVMMNDTPSYTAFSWLAHGLPNKIDLKVRPRDDIKISLNATSASTTIVVIENLTTHQCRTIDLHVPPFHRQIAGCFVADRALFASTAKSVDLATFGAVTFTDVKFNATTPDVIESDIAIIQVDRKNLTSVSVDGKSITITRL